MLARYVWADLTRNPRRTLSTMVGVILGVGLSCALLFLVDGLSASMTQRAVAPLPIDMQHVLTDPVGGDLRLDQEVEPVGPVPIGTVVRVRLVLRNAGSVAANEVVVRSRPPAGLAFVAGSATLDGESIDAGNDNPLAMGPARVGMNVGTVEADSTRIFEYEATATLAANVATDPLAAVVLSTVSSREAVTPVAANAADPIDLARLAIDIAAIDGVAFAEPLSFVDLPPRSMSGHGTTEPGAVRVFGFDAGYTDHDDTIDIVDGTQQSGAALLSVEAASALGVGIGDTVSVQLPDGTRAKVTISGTVDLARARSLFASRQGADFETFVYVPNALVIDTAAFADVVVPAYERAATERGERVKSPPLREIDIGVERGLLDADPGTALHQTELIALRVSAIAGQQDFLLDNISNTLSVARADAGVAKRLFVFLGVPAALLAAILAAYAGNVLAGAQRREQATLRIRGASRGILLSMLVRRVSCITAAGAVIGVTLGYTSAAIVLGNGTLTRASRHSLAASAGIGIVAGLFATGTALFVTGRRAIDREIDDDRARWAHRIPVWRRYRLDMIAVLVVAIATAVAVSQSAFNGTPGSVYVGRSVRLSLVLLLLPIVAWLAGGLLAGRLVARLLRIRRAQPTVNFDRTLTFLYRTSVRRRSLAVAEASVVVGLIVALGTSLAVFTASYDAAKAADARYVLGSDIRITPSPSGEHTYRSSDRAEFLIDGIRTITPVVYGYQNVIVRSDRTSDPANLAAVDPEAYRQVAPLRDDQFRTASAARAINLLVEQPNAILLNADFAEFLQAEIGDTLIVLLARGTDEQVETELELVGLYERLPGFPDGADALMNIAGHEAALPTTTPDFFLAQTTDGSDATLNRVVAELRNGQAIDQRLHIETRATALATDQSSLAALNIRGLLDLDSAYALAMGTAAIAIFVFGLLLQRRREYVTLRAQGLQPRSIRTLIGAEAATVAIAGCLSGLVVGMVMAAYLIGVLRPLFVLAPSYHIPIGATATIVVSVLVAAAITSLAASSLVNRLRATELLRDD